MGERIFTSRRVTGRGWLALVGLAACMLAGATMPLAALQRPVQAAPPSTQHPAQPQSPGQMIGHPAEATSPAPPAAASDSGTGLVDEIGKLFRAPAWTLPEISLPELPKMKSPMEALEDLTARNKAATEALTSSKVVTGRTVCPVAANGAPDCKSGADNLCRSKGYKEGRSLDGDATRTCSPAAMLSGRKLQDSDCKTENFVTRAICQ